MPKGGFTIYRQRVAVIEQVFERLKKNCKHSQGTASALFPGT